ncbi:MAG TPA: TraR/DksA C4-type zinc finger protein [Chloroflexota bacterium]|jgi:RNA polymerase-binding transcription factor DksA
MKTRGNRVQESTEGLPNRGFNLDGALAALIATRGLLLEEASRLGAEERALAESRNEEGRPGPESADVASDATGQEIAEALERQMRGQLLEIDAALHRIDAGRYGLCERCGGPIDPARVRALPWARYCLICQKRTEQRAS